MKKYNYLWSIYSNFIGRSDYRLRTNWNICLDRNKNAGWGILHLSMKNRAAIFYPEKTPDSQGRIIICLYILFSLLFLWQSGIQGPGGLSQGFSFRDLHAVGDSSQLATTYLVEDHPRSNPPWYPRWWAFASYFGVLFLLLSVTFFRIIRERKLNRGPAIRLREIEALKKGLHTNIIRKFYTSLTLILDLTKDYNQKERENQDEAMSLIRRNGLDLLELVKQMQGLSKLEPGELGLQPEQLLFHRQPFQSFYSSPITDAEPPEAAFLTKVRHCILQHIDQEDFGVEELAEAVFLSRTQLFRKIKSLTGRSVAAFIHKVRIGRVKQLLTTSELTISEIAFQTGFSDPSYLRRVFLKETGETLVDYRNRLR